MKSRIIFFVLLIISFNGIAQECDMRIRVIDYQTEAPLPYCYICTENIENGTREFFATNLDGLVDLSFTSPTEIEISFIGYHTVVDTISCEKSSLTYRLIPEAFALSELVVTGQNRPIAVDKSIYNIKVIGAERIEQTASNNLAELLNNELNVSISNDPSTGSSLKMQGITGENIKILVDGIPVIGRLNGNIDLSQINLTQVDHIEVVEGPMSVMYGSNALGGVVNIITKENRYAKLRATINAYYESVGVYNLDGSFFLKMNDHNLGFTFGRNFFEGYALNSDSRSQDWKPKEHYFAGLQHKYSRNKFMIKSKLDYFRERLLDRSDLLPAYYTMGYDTWFYTNRLNANVNSTYDFNANSSLNVLISYAYYSRIKNKYLKDMTTLESQLTPSSDDQDTSVFNAFVVKGVYDFSSDNKKISFQTGLDINIEDSEGERIENGYQQIGDYAVFGSMEWDVGSQLSLQPAVRLAYNSRYNAPIVPSLNLKYQLNKTAFRLSYARGFRAPSLKELYLYFYDSNHQIEGNDDLKAERSHNYNLAVKQELVFLNRDADIKCTAFYNQISNKITLVQVDPEDPLHYRNENIGKYETLGAQFLLNFKPTVFSDFQLGVSETGSRDDYYSKTGFTYSTNATANMAFNLFKNTTTFSIIYKYIGKYPSYAYNSENEVELNYVEGYNNLDITLVKMFFNQKLVLSTGVKNVFNNTEIQGVESGNSVHGSSTSSMVGWGTTFFFGVKYNISKYAK